MIIINSQQLPYPPYTVDIFLSTIGSILPLLLIMAFLYSAGTTVKVLHVCSSGSTARFYQYYGDSSYLYVYLYRVTSADYGLPYRPGKVD